MITWTLISLEIPMQSLTSTWKFIASVEVIGSWCIPILTSGGVVLRESGDTSLTCGFPFVEGGYEDGRPMEIGA